MRYNNIGGIMLSSLDMDDNSGLFCTGDIYPLLITIHEQLDVPLPPNPYIGRPKNRKQPIQMGYSNNTNVVTPPSVTTPQTTYPTTSTTTATTDLSSTEIQPYPTTIIYVYETTTDNTPPFNSTESFQGDVKPWSEVSGLSDQPGSLQSQHSDASQTPVSAHTSGAADQINVQNTSGLSTKESNRQQIIDSPQGTGGMQKTPQTESNAFGKDVQSTSSIGVKDQQKFQVPNKTTLMNATDISKNNEPLQEKQIRTFLNNAANLPTHRLINGILKILSHNDQVTERAPIATTLPPTTTTTTKRPKSRVHAVLPISILRSFKGSVSLFGGAKALERRPLRQDVSNIWDDPYAQQFLRNSKTFTSKRNAATKLPSSRP